MTRDEVKALPAGTVVRWHDPKTRASHFGRLTNVGHKVATITIGGTLMPPQRKRVPFGDLSPFGGRDA